MTLIRFITYLLSGYCLRVELFPVSVSHTHVSCILLYCIIYRSVLSEAFKTFYRIQTFNKKYFFYFKQVDYIIYSRGSRRVFVFQLMYKFNKIPACRMYVFIVKFYGWYRIIHMTNTPRRVLVVLVWRDSARYRTRPVQETTPNYLSTNTPRS